MPRIPVTGVLWLMLVFLGACGPSKPQRLQIGDVAPGFSVTAIDGRNLSRQQQKNHPVVLRFFQPDCPYCQADTRVFNDYYRRYQKEGLAVVYLAEWNNDAEVKDFAEKLKIPFPVVIDHGGRVAALYQVKVLPQTIVISPAGKITAAMVGGVAGEQLDEIVKPLLSLPH